MKRVLKTVLLVISFLLIISGLGNTLFMYINDGSISNTYRFNTGIITLIMGCILLYINKKLNKQ